MTIDIIPLLEESSYQKIITKKNNKGDIVTDKSLISNFIIEITKIIQCKKKLEIHAFLVKGINNKIKKNFIIFESSDFQDVKSFRRKINNKFMNYKFIGTDNDLEIIKALLGETIPAEKIIEGIEYVGLIKKDGKWQYIDKTSETNVVTENDNIIDESFDVQNIPSEEELLSIAEALFDFNEPSVVYPLLAIAAKGIIHERLKKLGIKVFIGIVTGEAGIGKSESFEKVVRPISHSKNAEIAGSIKEFTTYKLLSSSNVFSLNIEEYKEHKLDQRRKDLISTALRSAYDGHATKRGRIDQTINDYQIRNSINVYGETSFEEKAIRERSIEALFKNLHKSPEETQRFKDNLEKLGEKEDILYKLGNLVLLTVLNMKDDDILETYNKCYKLFENNFADRVKKNIVVATICYKLYYDIFKNIYNMKPIEEIFEIIENSQKGNSKTKSKSIVENTLELISLLIEKKILVNFDDYVIKIEEKNDNMICFRFTQTYHKLTKYVKEHNLKEEIYEKRFDFIKQLENTSYFIEKNKVIRADWINKKNTQKCCVLNLYELQNLDFCIKGKIINMKNSDDDHKDNIDHGHNFNFFDGLSNNDDDDGNLPLPD